MTLLPSGYSITIGVTVAVIVLRVVETSKGKLMRLGSQSTETVHPVQADVAVVKGSVEVEFSHGTVAYVRWNLQKGISRVDTCSTRCGSRQRGELSKQKEGRGNCAHNECRSRSQQVGGTIVCWVLFGGIRALQSTISCKAIQGDNHRSSQSISQSRSDGPASEVVSGLRSANCF